MHTHDHSGGKRHRAMPPHVPLLTGLWLACALVGAGIITPTAAESPRQPPSHSRHQPVGSSLVTYDVAAFGVPIPILLSFGADGVMIETDSPAPTPVGSLGMLILSNGRGAWVPTKGGEFAYLYRKLIYKEDGLTPFGTTRTSATGTISPDGKQLQATIVIEFLDVQRNLLFPASGTAAGTKIEVHAE